MCGRNLWSSALVVSSLAIASAAQAGTYRTIDVFGDPATEWAGIDPITTSIVNPGVNIDFTSLSIANDSNYVYMKLTYNTAVNPNQNWTGVHLAVDSDNSGSTGHTITLNGYTFENFGSDVMWENDAGYAQTASDWALAGVLTDASYGAYPYYGADSDPAHITAYQQIRIPLNAFNTVIGQPIFGSSFTLMFFTQESPLDYIGPVTYTVAEVPEPATMGVLALAGSALLLRRRS